MAELALRTPTLDKDRVLQWLQKYGVYAGVAVLLVVNIAITPHFLSAENFRTQAVQVAPVIIVALELLGVVTPRRLIGWWRPASVIIVIIAAVITPSGDPISMTALAVPMLLLYFASIGVGALVLKLRARKRRKEGEAEPVDADG